MFQQMVKLFQNFEREEQIIFLSEFPQFHQNRQNFRNIFLTELYFSVARKTSCRLNFISTMTRAIIFKIRLRCFLDAQLDSRYSKCADGNPEVCGKSEILPYIFADSLVYGLRQYKAWQRRHLRRMYKKMNGTIFMKAKKISQDFNFLIDLTK